MPLLTQDAGNADVQIRLGEVKKRQNSSGLIDGYIWESPSGCGFEVKEVGRFFIGKGREIVIEPIGDLKIEKIQAYLFGTAFGILMHQRGDVPLHVSAVARQDSAVVAFSGPSGAGKSTMAACLSKTDGLSIFTDDVLRVTFTGADVTVNPGPRNMKLWEDACNHLALATSSGTRDFAREKKFHFDITGDHLHKFYSVPDFVFLARSANGETNMRQVYGEQRLRVISSSIYRSNLGIQIQGGRDLFMKCSVLAGQSRAFILERPREFDKIQASIQLVNQIFF